MISVLSISLQASAIGYGQGKQLGADHRPIGAVDFQAQYGEKYAFALSSDAKRIILTFDQGYENGYTEKILDTLKENNVNAIFFLTGDYAKKEPTLVKRMIAEGHTLCNHGMTHAKLLNLTVAGIENELMDLHYYVQDCYNYEMQYFRLPCGEYDSQSLDIAHLLGYHTIFWSFAYVDWMTQQQPNPSEALQKLTDAAHDGAIYLLHSVSYRNASILGDLIDNLPVKVILFNESLLWRYGSSQEAFLILICIC